MLIIFLLLLIGASIMVLLVKRNKETFYLFAMCMSLASMLTGILIYIAKKGGISRELQNFLFFTNEIKVKIQYLLITLDGLGFTIGIGRYLFPMFLLLLAVHYSMIPWIQRNHWINKVIFIMPIISLIVYYPDVFRFLTNGNPGLQQVIINCTFFWIVLYVMISISLLLYEAYFINLKVFQRQFILIIMFIFSLSLLYLLYFGQDPAQVYQFYSADFIWRKGIYYLKSTLSVSAYSLIILLNVICAIVGFGSLLKYTQEVFESSREGVIIKHKLDVINTSTSVFVHSIKNQLLANRVIFKRISRIYDQKTIDIATLKNHTAKIEKQNENMLARIEELYRSVKTNQVHLVPIRLETIIENSIGRFRNKYHNEAIDVELRTHTTILADQSHLSEAIYNLLLNAQEAVNDAEHDGKAKIKLSSYNIRLHTVIEIKDNGAGMSKEEMKKICEPFYSNKNSNYNWGMGLYYVRTIANEHFGSLRYESEEGKGSTFYLLLPKYKE